MVNWEFYDDTLGIFNDKGQLTETVKTVDLVMFYIKHEGYKESE